MENCEKSSWSTGRAVGRRKEIVEYRHPYGQLEAEERFSGELGGSRGVIVFCIMYNSPTQLGSRSLASATPASRRARYICCTGLVLYRIQPLTVTTSWIFASSSSRFFFSFLSLFPSFCSFLFPLFHFYSVLLGLSSLFSPVLASDFSYFRFALSILAVTSFFQCRPLGQFCVSQSSSYGNGEPRGRTMSHNFDNSTTGASFMRWSLYRDNSYDDIAV